MTASSNFKPEKEKDNWDAAKLTDGTRINTRVGHHGWTSALYDDGKHTEWVQVDLGQPVECQGDPACGRWTTATPGRIRTAPSRSSSRREIDQSYDGFPLDFRILVSEDGKAWDEVTKARSVSPAGGRGRTTRDRKPRDVTGPERFEFTPRVLPVREDRGHAPPQDSLLRQICDAVGRDRGRPRRHETVSRETRKFQIRSTKSQTNPKFEIPMTEMHGQVQWWAEPTLPLPLGPCPLPKGRAVYAPAYLSEWLNYR